MNLNKLLLIGNLTRDPQLTYLPSNTPVVEFGMAINHKFKVNGEKREDVCFIDCRCYGPRAEALSKYVHKGDPLFVDGRLQLDTWKAQDGSNRSKHRVFVNDFQFMGGKPQGDEAQPQAQPPAADDELGF